MENARKVPRTPNRPTSNAVFDREKIKEANRLREKFESLVLQPHSCWPKTERAKRGAEVAALGPFIQFRGCSECAFAPSFSPEKLQIRELRL